MAVVPPCEVAIVRGCATCLTECTADEAGCGEDPKLGTGEDTDDTILEGPNGIKKPMGGAADGSGATFDVGVEHDIAGRRSDGAALVADVRTGI
jgi:hypothetical protein